MCGSRKVGWEQVRLYLCKRQICYKQWCHNLSLGALWFWVLLQICPRFPSRSLYMPVYLLVLSWVSDMPAPCSCLIFLTVIVFFFFLNKCFTEQWTTGILCYQHFMKRATANTPFILIESACHLILKLPSGL